MQLDDLVRAGIVPPKSHDLVFLHQLCARNAGYDVDNVDLCSRLTPFAVEHRYPIQSSIDENEVVADIESAVELARRIRDQVTSQLRDNQSDPAG